MNSQSLWGNPRRAIGLRFGGSSEQNSGHKVQSALVWVHSKATQQTTSTYPVSAWSPGDRAAPG